MPNKEFTFQSSKQFIIEPTYFFFPLSQQALRRAAMGKKMKLPLLFKTADQPRSSWLWRSCSQPRTLSFRTAGYDIFRTINSAYLDNAAVEGETPRADTPSTTSDDEGDDQIEAVVRGLRPGGRLFLELEETNSIMEAAKEEEADRFPFKESMVLSMDSKDPYLDFKKSMEEMVEAHGLKDWKGMGELLSWYLKANGKSNHDYIIGAFVDLLVGVAFSSMKCSSSSSCCCYSCNSPSSLLSSSFASSSSFSTTATPCISSVEIEEIDCSSTTPCLSSLFEDDEEELEDFKPKQQ